MTKGRTYIVAVEDANGRTFAETLQYATTPRGAVNALKRQDSYYRRIVKHGGKLTARPYTSEAGTMLYTFCVATLVLFAILVMLVPVLIRALEVVQ